MASNIATQTPADETFLHSRELLESLFDSIPGAVVVCDDEGRIVQVNAEVENLFGYTRTELLCQPVGILFPERLHTVQLGYGHYYPGTSAPRSGCRVGALRKAQGRQRVSD